MRLADHNFVQDLNRVYCSKCERTYTEVLSQVIACQGNLLQSERAEIEAERDRIWIAVRDVANGSGPTLIVES